MSISLCTYEMITENFDIAIPEREGALERKQITTIRDVVKFAAPTTPIH